MPRCQGAPAAPADLERFIDSQRRRDRAMAERPPAAGRREPGRLLVALVGRGHMEGDDGVVLVRQVAPGSAAAAAGGPLRLTLQREGRSLELTEPLAPASGGNGRHLPLASSPPAPP
ncbi:MAG: ChaN family lipoprotein, partial [Synechococcus sp. Tobar2m-G35]|nr:ChaN family lipoprotein [Synechococcus sp. Tobar2m-G35]